MCGHGKGPREWTSFMQTSHAPFMLAAWLAWRAGWRLHAAVCVASVTCSLIYHRSREHRCSHADHLLAYALIAMNAWRLWYRWNWPAFACAMLSGVLYFLCQRSNRHDVYDTYHPWWHILTGVGTVLLYIDDDDE
jgi:predicted membrane channel-forming protein YqfA (hemolysin III family)